LEDRKLNLKLSVMSDLPLGRQKNKPQVVRYVGLTTWKIENKPQAVRYVGLITWKKDEK